MPVATLTLEWSGHPEPPGVENQPGWCVQICGPNIASVNLARHKFVKARSGPFKGDQFGQSVGTGPIAWMMTPTQEPLLGWGNGATQELLPMGQVTEYLEMLEGKGFKVVASHSTVTGAQNGHIISVWTLQRPQ